MRKFFKSTTTKDIKASINCLVDIISTKIYPSESVLTILIHLDSNIIYLTSLKNESRFH